MPSSEPPRRDEAAEAVRHPAAAGDLRELASRHRVRLSVVRDFGPDERWRPQPVGFEVDLRAAVLADRPLDDEAAQRAAYDVTVTVARDAFRTLDDDPAIAYEFDDFDRHVVVEPNGGAVEIELSAHVYHRSGVRRPLDDTERAAVERVRDRLRSLGVRE